MDKENFQKYIKLINFKANFLSTEFFAGEYESAFKGRGLEFQEVREYEPGDDVRLIDWKSTARMGKLHVKKFHEEREISVILMVDISRSMYFGTKWKLKSELATEISALLSYTALKSNDKVGLILFGDKVYKYIPPKKGTIHVWNIIREIITFKKEIKNTDIEEALKFLTKVIKRRAVVFIISDFICADFSRILKVLKRKFDFVPVFIIDKFEKEIFNEVKNFNFLFKDNEKNLNISIKLKENLNTILNEFFAHRVNYFKKANIEPLIIYTHIPYIQGFIEYFQKRKR